MRNDRNARFCAYALRRRERSQQSLAAFFAFAEIRRTARLWARFPPTAPMVIVLIVPVGGDLSAHATSARLVFDDPIGHSDRAGSCVVVMERQPSGTIGTTADSAWLLANGTRIVVVTREPDDVPETLRFAADEVVQLEAPCAAHLLAAARLVLNSPMSKDEAERLQDEPVDVLVATLRSGRPAARSIAIVNRLQEARHVQPPGPSLEDLHGLGEVGEWGRELTRDVADWRAGYIGWAQVDRGMLLSGPPGTGKTMFAAALARSARMSLVVGSVARWQATGRLDDLLAAMRQAFDEARRRAPAILFIDEVDAVGDREGFSGENGQYHAQVVAALLECLDGAEGREGVVVVGATNRPQALDPALCRPGRLDRHLAMPLPDGGARQAILRFHLGEGAEDIDLSHVASRTPGWTGAMLERLARHARRRARREGKPLATGHLDACLPGSILLSDAYVWRTAVHEAGHVVVAECLRPGSVLKALLHRRIELAGLAPPGGGAMVHKRLDPGHQTVHDILDDVAISISGGVAEELFFGQRSTASGGWPTSDLHVATLDLLRLELSFGLGEGLAFVVPSSDDRALLENLALDGALRGRVEAGLRQQKERVSAMLGLRLSSVETIAEALRDRGELDPVEVRRLLHAASCKQNGRANTCNRGLGDERS